MPPPPTGFSNFSQKWEELFLQTKFLAVGSSLGHLSMKNFFHIGPAILALKLDEGRVLGGGGGNHPPTLSKSLPIFLTMKMTFNLNKF